MATSRLVPVMVALYNTILAAAPEDLQVSLGPATSDDPGDYLWIGADASDTLSDAFSGSTTQAPATSGTPRSRDENGTITCFVESWNGDEDMIAAAETAQSYVDLVENALRTDPTVGTGLDGRLVVQFGSVQAATNAQDNDGAHFFMIFNCTYWTRI